MKICKKCGSVRENTKIRCRICNVKNQKRWSKENLDKRHENTKKIREKWLELFRILEYDKCSKCGYNQCFAAIDFHHRNRENKKFSIGRLISCACNTENITKTLEEIKKCDILCANCHRELHYLNGGNSVSTNYTLGKPFSAGGKN
jgi:hypothetical protein